MDNATTLMKLNITSDQLRDWARANRQIALMVCKAQAAALVIREQVDSYIEPIFDSFHFTYCGSTAEALDERSGEKFLGKSLPLEDLHLCDDPRLEEYFATCDAAHRAHGYDLPKGHCPALHAEHLLFQAQGVLIEAAEPIAGIKRYMLVGSGNEKKYLDLLIKACLAETSDKEINHYVEQAA